MTGVGALALVTNVSVALLLYRFRSGDANMRSVWVCSRNDAINNLLVIGAGFVVLWTGSGLADLVVALIMALLGLQGGWQVVRQARYELAARRASGMKQLEVAYRAEIEAFRQARAGQDAADRGTIWNGRISCLSRSCGSTSMPTRSC